MQHSTHNHTRPQATTTPNQKALGQPRTHAAKDNTHQTGVPSGPNSVPNHSLTFIAFHPVTPDPHSGPTVRSQLRNQHIPTFQKKRKKRAGAPPHGETP